MEYGHKAVSILLKTIQEKNALFDKQRATAAWHLRKWEGNARNPEQAEAHWLRYTKLTDECEELGIMLCKLRNTVIRIHSM